MDLSTAILIIVISLTLEVFFSGSEIALISVNRIKLKHKADEGSAPARAALTLLSVPDKIFASTSLGTNLCVVTSTSAFTAYMVERFAEKGDILATLIMSPIILFGGELFPKVVFQSRADSIIFYLVKPLNFFIKIFAPVISFLTRISNFLSRRFLTQRNGTQKTFSRDQLQEILRLDTHKFDLGSAERRMIHKIFDFGEITVEQCMVPLVQIVALKDTATMEEAHEMAIESGFSRLPVFHDRMFNLIGVLNTFDLLNQPIDNSPVTDLIRPAYYVPPNKKIHDLLNELQQRGLHMAIVVDEYGGCIGMATIEDLLEEIVGEIEDEYDKQEGARYETYADEGYLIGGDMEIDSINETLNLNLPRGDYETLAGLVINKLEKIPPAGEQVVVNGYRLTVKEASKRKILSIIVRKLTPASDQSPQPAQTPDENAA